MVEELEYINKVYNGLIENERMFAMLYYADEEHLWDDYGLQQANPLRAAVIYDDLKDKRTMALEKVSARVEFITKNMNRFMPAYSGESFVDINNLRKCKVHDFDWTGRHVYLGVDLSQTTDNTAVAMVTQVKGNIYAKVVGFIPGSKIDEKSKLEKVDYRRFIDKGYCKACGDEVIDYGAVERFILGVESEYGVRIEHIGYDRYNALSSMMKMEEAGYSTVEVGQKPNVLHPPTKLLRESILNGTFFYDENDMLEINFANAKAFEDSNLNIWLHKKKSTGKIDMLAAIVNGIYLLNVYELVGQEALSWACQF